MFLSLIGTLDAFDKQLFLSLQPSGTPFWDTVMTLCTDRFFWIPLYLFLVVYIVCKYRKQSLWIIAAVVLTILLADQFASGICKPWFMRPRPSHAPDLIGLVRTPAGVGDMYGFMSSHAANTFGLAVFISLLVRKTWVTILMLAWALLNCYTRLYLGFHYPGDLLCGAIMGSAFACMNYWILCKWVRPKLGYGA